MMTVTPQLINLIKKSINDIRYIGRIYISHARKHYVSHSVVHWYWYALCISVILQSSVHTSDWWRHAFIYRWIKFYEPLFRTYVRTHAQMSFCSHTLVFDVVSCMNLVWIYTEQYIRIQLPGKPSILLIHLFDMKKGNLKLGSYM